MRKVKNYSPLHRITEILVFSPGIEVVLGLLLKNALFEPGATETASVVAARSEHRQMVESFRAQNIHVTDLRHALGKYLTGMETPTPLDKDQLLAALTAKATYLRAHHGVGDLEHIYHELERMFYADVASMGEKAAIEVNAVLTGITDLEKKLQQVNGAFVPNIMFARDYLHVIGKRLVVNRMHFPIRQYETELVKLALQQLGIPFSILETTGSLEGGDVMPLELRNELFSVFGWGERTTLDGIEDCYRLHESEYSQSGEGLIPIIVEGPHADTQAEMHLDLVNQQVGRGEMIFCYDLVKKRTVGKLLKKHGQVRIVERVPMIEWLERHLSDGLDITLEEQQRYAPNLLLHGRGAQERPLAFLTRTDTPRVTTFIKKYSDIDQLNLINLTKFYGGVHCLTTEFRAQ